MAKKQEEVEVNEDEMIGFIMRKISEKDNIAPPNYEEVREVLDAEMEFLKVSGVAIEENV